MGDDQDFYALFNATLPVLFRALLVVTADRELATDAAAEALSRAWQRWPELNNPRAWVWQVAYNHVRAWWRRIAAHEVLIGVLDEDVELTAGALAAAAPAAAEVDLDLLKAIADLPAQQRAVVAGRYVVGLRPREVARALGIDRRTESEHHRRAIMTLRQRLAGWGNTDEE
jgi:RNA polymerase sigma factor (sigma-70 family)